MASSEKNGQRDAEKGKPSAPQGNMTAAEFKNYLQGYNNGKKN